MYQLKIDNKHNFKAALEFNHLADTILYHEMILEYDSKLSRDRFVKFISGQGLKDFRLATRRVEACPTSYKEI